MTSKRLQQAVVLHQQGNFAEAKKAYETIMQQSPHHPDAYHLLGVLAHQVGQHTQAVKLIEHAITLDPQAHFFNNLGLAYTALSTPHKAQQAYKEAITKDPKFAQAYYNLAHLYQQCAEYDKAMDYYHLALKQNPNYTRAFINLGNCYLQLQLWEDAKVCFEKALRLAPKSALAHTGMGNCYQGMNQPLAAESAYTAAIKHGDQCAETYYNLGTLYLHQQQFQDASKQLQMALHYQPDYADAYNQLALTYEMQGDFLAAEQTFLRALQLQDNPAWRVNLSHCQLLQGKLKSGWSNYDARFHKTEDQVLRSSLGKPLWQGQTLSGKTLYIGMEQGIGDEIMFAHAIPALIKEAEKIIVGCETRLIPLFRRSFPQAIIVDKTVLDQNTALTTYHIDWEISAGSIYQYRYPTPEHFPQHSGFLQADEVQQRVWQQRFATLGTGLKIGISWQGGKTPRTQGMRSTELRQWMELFRLPNCHFINLQYGDIAKQIAEFNKKFQTDLRHWQECDPLNNMDDFAAQISALDLVISIDNSTVHLAGALNIPCLVMLPKKPEWRWQNEGANCYWYPSLTLFRQAQWGQWSKVFAAIKTLLEARNH